MKLFTTLTLLLLGASQVVAAPNCADKYEVFDNTTVQAVPGLGYEPRRNDGANDHRLRILLLSLHGNGAAAGGKGSRREKHTKQSCGDSLHSDSLLLN